MIGKAGRSLRHIGLVPVVGIALVLAVVIFFAANRRNEAALQQMTQQWQIRLDLQAKYQAERVTRWVESQAAILTSLADNPSLQLYLTGNMGGESPGAAEIDEMFRDSVTAAHLGFVRNLLTATAARHGFAGGEKAVDAPFDLEPQTNAGLAIRGMNGRRFVATRGMPAPKHDFLAFVEKLTPGQRASSSLFTLEGEVVMAFAEPVYAVQGEQTASGQIGWILAVKPVAEPLYDLLKNELAVDSSMLSLLVEKQGERVRYLSPTPGRKTPPLKLELSAQDEQLAAAHALEHPGVFFIGSDYRGEKVLTTSQPIPGTGWLLIQKVDFEEALGGVLAEQKERMVQAGLLVLAAAIGIVALWWHGTSHREKEVRTRYQFLAKQYKAQEELLRAVTDSQHDLLFILDQNHRFQFVNAVMTDELQMPAKAMIGKSIDHVLGPARARPYIEQATKAIDSDETQSLTQRLEEAGGEREKVMQSRYIPLHGIAIPHVSGPISATLIVERDITDSVRERERRERTLEQLVRTLTTIVDSRDPYASYHSAMVAELAEAIAGRMKLKETAVQTVKTAGTLLNIGKIMVPVELLTKKTKLTAREARQLAEVPHYSAELLKGLEFDGPVAETIRLSTAVSGADKVAALPPEARILSAANAFVAIISPRAYRENASLDEAMDVMLADSGKKYDRAVVAALVNYIENHGGKAMLERHVSRLEETLEAR